MFTVDVRATNSGDRPLRGLKLSWDFPATVVRPVSRAASFDAFLAPHETTTVRYRFKALRRGVARLELFALGRGGGATASCVVRIG
jgi:uncharacterized protein (DUF58 family)